MWSDVERKGIYRDGLRIRAIAASAFLAFFLSGSSLGWASRIEGYWLVVCALAVLVAVNPLFWAIGVVRGFPLSDFYAHWALDIIAVSAVVYGLGMFDIPLVAVAYMIMIVSSAAYVTMAAAMLLAFGSTVAWLGLWLSTSMGWLTHKHVEFGVHWNSEGEIFLTIASIVFYFLFAYVSGSVARELRGKSLRLIEKQEQLSAAMELERQSRSRIELLSAIVQHDVHGPLSVIEGASSEARRALEEQRIADVGRFIRMIDQRLPGVSSAVESLGLFRDEVTGEAGLSVSVEEVVHSVFADLRGEVEERSVATTIHGESLSVEVDRRRLYHVLRNLVSNAIKCAPDDGTGSVVIEVTGDAGLGRIAVCDNGPGLSPALVGALTGHPIRTSVEKETSRSGGLGVGLSLARSVAEAWGGRLEYSAREGGGARISVFVPVSAL
jgi:two-component system, sensor histidine kinase RegB